MRTSSTLFKLACAGLALALSACASPPQGPPIVLHRVGAARPRPRPRQVEPCEPAVQAKLTDTEKANLFQEFDAWQRDRHREDASAEIALPPPGPIPQVTATTSRACRASSP